MIKYNNVPKLTKRKNGKMEELIAWLEEQLRQREWQASDLARRAGVGNSTIQRIMAGTRRAGKTVCSKIAVALGEPPEKVFRLAGLLPSIPEQETVEQDFLNEFRALSPQQREYLIDSMRGLKRKPREESPGDVTPDSAKIDAIYQALQGIIPEVLTSAIQAARSALVIDKPELEHIAEIWDALDAYERHLIWDFITWRFREQERRRDSDNKRIEEKRKEYREIIDLVEFREAVERATPQAIERTINLLRKRLEYLARKKPPAAAEDIPPPSEDSPPQGA